MFNCKFALSSLSLIPVLGVFFSGCSLDTDSTRTVEQGAVGECTTTSQCVSIYGSAADDCKNSLGGICYCGASACSESGAEAVSIPDRIEAEEFVDFEESNPAHSGDCGSGPVDMETTSDSAGGACNVGWTEAGESLSYLVSSGGGSFDIVLRLAAQSAGKTVAVKVDGVTVGQVEAPSAGWQGFANRTLSNVSIPAGEHTVQIVFVTGQVNFNFMDIETAEAPTGDATPIPAKIEAEDFDDFSDTTPNNQGDCGSGAVDQQATSDVGGGCNVGWTAPGETLSYELQSTGGDFDIDLRLAARNAGGSVSVLVDGALAGSVTAPANGWQAWQTVSLPGVSLPAGAHTLTIRFDNGGVNFNWLDVKSADSPPTAGSCEVKGTLRKWHRVELLCEGPSLGENQDATFVNRRMNVTFTNGSTTMTVPGHFAADGNAADSGSTSGNRWRAYLMPNLTGTWQYSVSFREGSNVAVSTAANAGTAVAGLDGQSGSFSVQNTNKSGRDTRAHGLLRHEAGDRYLRFAESGRAFVEGGVDSPENLFGYDEFDNTTKESNVGSCKGLLHSFAAHAGDWNSGDPTWKNGLGKNLVGTVNYLASTGVNAIYLVPMSVNGDGCDAHPWTDYYGNRKRFDVSKLDQWERVFSHMTEKGFLIHFVTQETENDQLLNSGSLGVERKLYYREIISRFGHHPALQWNLGEENTNTTAQVKSFADYIKEVDPYDHPVVMHTYPGQHANYEPLLGYNTFDGPTLQYGSIPTSGTGGLYGETISWINDSRQAGNTWVVTATEASGGQAPTPHSSVTKTQRVYWMYANVMAGGGGFEWYLKNSGSGHAYDLAVEDQREFDAHWQQSGHLVSFFNQLFPDEGFDLEALSPNNGLTSNGNDWVLADPGDAYLVFLRDGGSTNISVTGGGQYRVTWFNPRTGAQIDRANIGGSGNQSLGSAPQETNEDWLIFVRR